MVELKWCKVNSIDFENKVQGGAQLKLKNSVNYNVRYIENENRCVGILDFRLIDDEARPFSVRLGMEAVFTYGPEDTKEDIPILSFDQLFPFVRQAVYSITSMSGMQSLLIPMMRLNKANREILGNQDSDSMLN